MLTIGTSVASQRLLILLNVASQNRQRSTRPLADMARRHSSVESGSRNFKDGLLESGGGVAQSLQQEA